MKRNGVSAIEGGRGDILREQLESAEQRGYDLRKRLMCCQVFRAEGIIHHSTLKRVKLPFVSGQYFSHQSEPTEQNHSPLY